jgi:hypothetical protein
MPDAFFGFIAGLVFGLIAAVVIAAITMPPGVSYQHLTLSDAEFDCVTWRDQVVCEPAAPKLSQTRKP